MTKIIFDNITGDTCWTLNLREDQIRLLNWLKENGFLENVRILELDEDDFLFEEI